MHRKLTQVERSLAEDAERAIAQAPRRPCAAATFVPHRVRGGPRGRSLPAAGPAARRGGQARGAGRGLPTPSLPIDHFVVLMMENRSFDHYFGWLPDADAFSSAPTRTPTTAVRWSPRATPRRSGKHQWQRWRHPDPDHSWTGGRGAAGELKKTDPQHWSPTASWPVTTMSSRSATTTRATLGFIHRASRRPVPPPGRRASRPRSRPPR